jgi:hypothetical protein
MKVTGDRHRSSTELGTTSEETQQYAVFDAGGAAVGLVLDVVDLARGGGLVAAARMLP